MDNIFAFIATITAVQLVCHLIGDYPLQTSWMALGKTKSYVPAIAHGLVYSLPFVLVFHPSFAAWFVIVSTHVVIDRYRLAKRVCWAKEWLTFPFARPRPWDECKDNNGFAPGTPDYMGFWLMVIVDNTMHILINAAALYFLG